MKLGRYRLLAELARGGMGIVWLAETHGPGGFAKKCVVKELLPELAEDPRHRAMFLDEARLAARLGHKNIVQTYDLGADGKRLFMALELLEGASLRRVLTLLGKKTLRAPLAVRIACEVLAGLAHAHGLKDEEGRSLGVVHRDVSPSNVFLTFEGEVKLLDFGVARSRGHRDRTREGFVKGTARYMSPDHVAPRPIDVRADVFTVGVLLRELLAGEPVWGASSDATIIRRLVAGDVPSFTPRPDVPEALRAICELAMASEREKRFASASEMRVALERWLAENDPRGSLDELRALWKDELGHEVVRVRLVHRRGAESSSGAATKPPAPVELPSELLVTDPGLRVERPSTATRTRSRERFVLAMAIVAAVAATVSVVSTVLDDRGTTAVAPPP